MVTVQRRTFRIAYFYQVIAEVLPIDLLVQTREWMHQLKSVGAVETRKKAKCRTMDCWLEH